MSPPAKKKFNPENRNNLTTGEYLLYLELGEEEVDRKKEWGHGVKLIRKGSAWGNVSKIIILWNDIDI